MIVVDVALLKRSGSASAEPVFFTASPEAVGGYLPGLGYSAAPWPQRALEQLVRKHQRATA